MAQGDEEHRIYIGGIDEVTFEEFHDGCSQFGEIFNVFHDPHRGFGLVSYYHKEQAEDAMTNMHGSWWGASRPMRAEWAHGWPREMTATPTPRTTTCTCCTECPGVESEFHAVYNQTPQDNSSVYCGGLQNMTRPIMEQTFSPFGEIWDIYCVPSGLSILKYGFVAFKTKAAATNAIICLNNTILDQDVITVKWARNPRIRLAPALPSPVSTSLSPVSDTPTVSPAPVPSASNVPTAQPDLSSLLSRLATLWSGIDIASVPEPSATKAKETKVETKTEDKKVDLQCKICMDEQVGVVFLTCGHLASCPKCAQRISNCPMCRKRITGKVRTYLS